MLTNLSYVDIFRSLKSCNINTSENNINAMLENNFLPPPAEHNKEKRKFTHERLPGRHISDLDEEEISIAQICEGELKNVS